MKKQIICLITLVIALCAGATRAATITVRSSADSGGTCPGTTCTLRQAIATAASGDTINFALPPMTTITLASQLTIDNKSLNIQGPGATLLTISGNHAVRVFKIGRASNVGFTTTISGLKIANGIASSPNNDREGGGGIDNYGSSTTTISNCVISGNTSTDEGGGITNNFGVLTINNSVVSGNTAPSGGGISSDSNTVTINNSTISGNSANFGGGVYSSGTTNITNSSISGNSGGGILTYNTMNLTGSTVSGNTIVNGSAAIDTKGTMNVTNSTISGNAASGSNSQGIENSGTLTLSSSTVSGNSITANGYSGGIRTDVGATTNVKNTIIARNSTVNGSSQDVLGAFISQGYNLIGKSDGSTGFTNGVNHDQVGSNAAPIDPRLGPLQDNGGPTRTMALLSGSPALDKGNSFGLRTDQRGTPRPIDLPTIPNAPGGDGADMGAFELTGNQLLNISTRLEVLTGNQVAIGGFIIKGTANKQVLVRALGPTLAQFGVTGVLGNPFLSLHHTDAQGHDTLLTTNDNWKVPNQAAIAATGKAPPNDLESAILASLAPGNYTAIVSGVNNSTGVGLVEVYDLDQSASTTLANISTRGFVGTGSNAMIGGFISGGTGTKVIVRALGPTLSQFGVTTVLANPTLELHDANGALLASNDNWQQGTQAAQIQASGYAPPNALEPAIIITRPAGSTTAIVKGVNNTTGNALVEVYTLPPQ